VTLIERIVDLFLGKQHSCPAQRVFATTPGKEHLDTSRNYTSLPYIKGYRPRLGDFPPLPSTLMCDGDFGAPDFAGCCRECGLPFHIVNRVKLAGSGFSCGKAWARVKIGWQCDNGHEFVSNHIYRPEQQKWSNGFRYDADVLIWDCWRWSNGFYIGI
jgi:hypothetical protein